MTDPGPVADRAFTLGIVAAATAGASVLAGLYGSGALALPLAVYVLVALFPVYLVAVASVLSVWLGYDRDATDLRPVTRRES
jgi:hypothetical protein